MRRRIPVDEILREARAAKDANPGEGKDEWDDAVNLVLIGLGLRVDCIACGEQHDVDELGRCGHCRRSVRGHRRLCPSALCAECERTVERAHD